MLFFPFSKQGVIRASKASPFWNLLPELDTVSVKSASFNIIEDGLKVDIGTNCFIRSLDNAILGSNTIISDILLIFHPSGTQPTASVVLLLLALAILYLLQSRMEDAIRNAKALAMSNADKNRLNLRTVPQFII